VGDGTSYFLLAISKRPWPRFPIRVGRFTLLNVPHASKEVESLPGIYLCTRDPRGHTLKGIVRDHAKLVGLVHPITHDVNFIKEILKGTLII
jgi:hypothetical protein